MAVRRLRAVILGVEATALAGLVTFSIAGGMHTRQPIFVVLQFLCGVLIVAGELAVRRIDSQADDSIAKGH